MMSLIFFGPYSVFFNLNGCCFVVLYVTALVEQVMSLSGGCSRIVFWHSSYRDSDEFDWRCAVVVSITIPIEKVMSLTGCCSVVVSITVPIEKVMSLTAAALW